MASPSAAALHAALALYRARVAAQNRRALDVWVPFIAAAAFDDDPAELEDVEDLRMRSLASLLDVDAAALRSNGVRRPADVLESCGTTETAAAAVVRLYALDGVARDPHLADAERTRLWEEYFSLVLAELRRTCEEEVLDEVAIPEDLVLLAAEADAVVGAGLPNYRAAFQVAFFWGLRDLLDGNRSRVRQRVRRPWELKMATGLGGGWEVGAGWELGEGPGGHFCAVYCRRDGGQGWEWRYTFLSQEDHSSVVFEDVADVLEWYATFNEERVPAVEELSAEDVLMCMF
ncbi:hypothetical protein C8035_v011247 [Colletotrichum spinosum]|uniref:Uncharacterized protein n=1 Tax=Colletotrichum spinosum TaxID=1347390 RepID=A0A4R8Q696_9PEZI|nr:hypothetical protein C8035_v011247 [Colletotrichum spinosum]